MLSGSVPPVGCQGRRAFRGCGISPAGAARMTRVTCCEGAAMAARALRTRQCETKKKMSPYRKSQFLPLPVFVLIVLWGCASLLQQREWVILKINSSTRYYSVRGMTTGAIFDDIDRNGLFDNKARRAMGLTSGEWSMDWKGIGTRSAFCSPESMTITLNLVVTLPQHDHLNDLSQDIRTNWQRFAARVAAHEQRHVDIYLNGAKTTKARMEAILARPS